MVQTLAIRGHYYNGNKVISLLTSLGGNNTKGYDGSKIDYFYYINSNGEIDCILQDDMLIFQWETHSLLSFSEEYGNNPPQRFYYNKNIDKGKILNQEFNEIYNLISDVDNLVDMFYVEHILYNKDIDANSDIFSQVSKLQMMMSEVKCLSHDIAEYFTWDN
jgi:hypothetical protein